MEKLLEIRIMEVADYPCLTEFLYQAIFVPKGKVSPPRNTINRPEIFIYLQDFGNRIGDLGVVAEQDGLVVGAAWTRIIPAYGHLDQNTPELAISVLPQFRNCGIGTKLMHKLFKVLQRNGFSQTSLSVQKSNPAVHFYLRLGYVPVRSRQVGRDDYLMIKAL